MFKSLARKNIEHRGLFSPRPQVFKVVRDKKAEKQKKPEILFSMTSRHHLVTSYVFFPHLKLKLSPKSESAKFCVVIKNTSIFDKQKKMKWQKFDEKIILKSKKTIEIFMLTHSIPTKALSLSLTTTRLLI